MRLGATPIVYFEGPTKGKVGIGTAAPGDYLTVDSSADDDPAMVEMCA